MIALESADYKKATLPEAALELAARFVGAFFAVFALISCVAIAYRALVTGR